MANSITSPIKSSANSATSKIGPEKRGQNEDEVMREMLPFFLYAAIPIFITIMLAWTFGPS